MSAPRPLQGVEVDPKARVQACRSCGALIWWGKTAKGKPCPFDVVDDEQTTVSHFSTCPQARAWSKR